MISIEQAYELLDQNVASLPVESTELADAVGCILAESVSADVDSPPHDKSVMDGFAVRSADVAANHKRLKIVETIIAGSWPDKELSPGEAARIMTGAPRPVGAVAVVLVEQT
jgi:molybdopterin molybdotransferase